MPSVVSPVLRPGWAAASVLVAPGDASAQPTYTGGIPIKRLVIILTLAVGFVVPAVANASRVATGSTRTAIIRADRSSPVNTGRFPPQRCLIARVTTKDGGNWAKVSFNAAQRRTCLDWPFNGADVMHRVDGRWHYVTGGSAMVPCGRSGIPVAVRLDLNLACAVTLPTGPAGARHLQGFLSPDRKTWCANNGGPPAPFFCAAAPALRSFPEFSAEVFSSGKVTICSIPHLIQQPGHPPDTCFQNWDADAPVLRAGEQNFVDGVLCKSQSTGITCTLTAGAGKGKGFLINSTSVTRVGP